MKARRACWMSRVSATSWIGRMYRSNCGFDFMNSVMGASCAWREASAAEMHIGTGERSVEPCPSQVARTEAELHTHSIAEGERMELALQHREQVADRLVGAVQDITAELFAIGGAPNATEQTLRAGV